MAIVLVLLAIVLAGIGVLSLSQATTGVGFLAAGCFLGILARLAQADAQQKEIRNLLQASSQNLKTVPKEIDTVNQVSR